MTCIKTEVYGYRNKADLLYNKLDKPEEALELFNLAVEVEPKMQLITLIELHSIMIKKIGK